MTLSELETAFDALPAAEKAQFAATVMPAVVEEIDPIHPENSISVGDFLDRWVPSGDPDLAEDLDAANEKIELWMNPWE